MAVVNIITEKEKINIIIDSFLVELFTSDWQTIPENELRHIGEQLNYDYIPDRVIASNEKVKRTINWQKISRTKLIRLIIRDVEISEIVDLSSYNYKLRELKYLLNVHPELIERFNYDFSNLTRKDDAVIILSVGNQYFIESGIVEQILNNISGFTFSSKEINDISRVYGYDKDVLCKFDLHNLDSFYIAEILKQMDESYVELFDLSRVSPKKWVEILERKPEYLKYCNVDIFKKTDIYNVVRLVCLFPELLYLLDEKNLYRDLSAMGWEKLLIHYPDYIEECNFMKLNEINWNNILSRRPELAVFKI